MHIKKLEVYGFKSFGFKNTTVHFEKGLVAITGPNGSGKSNILDAIMFAIGENSPKSLRVDKFQSLFHDSQNSNHRLIRVSLTFDNTDRGIPIDSDIITLTRGIEGQSGESQYWLDDKKVTKTTIMELLEVVLAAPNKLNIVQQGMITRISELNSEERRKIIEDIVGLSYFDEKKAEALKQLDEADRRLEVAFARMGEVRKRIDELETERNEQLRYDHLNTELKRLKAVQISNSIRGMRRKLATSAQILESNNQKSSHLSKLIEEAQIEIEKLDAEKSRFIQEVDAANRAKAQVSMRISGIVHDSERTKAMLSEFERRMADIERRLPSLQTSKQAAIQRIENTRSEIDRLKIQSEQNDATMKDLKTKLATVEDEIERKTAEVAKYSTFQSRLEKRLARMISLKGQIELVSARVEEKIKTINYKKDSNDSAIRALQAEILATKGRIAQLARSLEVDEAKLNNATKMASELAEIKSKLENEVTGSADLLVRAENLVNKFEERATIAKNARNEDLAIAELMKEKDKFSICGLVYDLLRWDKYYERPVLAAGSEWMKAFVVNDIKSMIMMAAYAKEQKLPRLRIIPLDVTGRFREKLKIPLDQPNIIGRLSDFVQSDYEKLPAFLFSDILLVRNSSTAFMLSRRGYRSVSIDGELFEPAGGSMSVDFGGRITDMTKAITFGKSVVDLRTMITTLSNRVDEKNTELRDISKRIFDCESEKVQLELLIKDFQRSITKEKESLETKEKSISKLIEYNQTLQLEVDEQAKEIEKSLRRLTLLSPAIEKIKLRLQSLGEEPSSKNRLAEMNVDRAHIVKQIEVLNIEIGRMISILRGL
ncbi:MAG: chromosome segregation protein SMC, partial [Thermoproteota archaeon]|nr:chromosome segregation protein SMC [Thermoproteota archaeon]